jgi:hypothetical protein
MKNKEIDVSVRHKFGAKRRAGGNLDDQCFHTGNHGASLQQKIKLPMSI